MKKITQINLCLAFFCLFSNSVNAFYAHLYGPSYTCPNSELSYYYDDDYGGGNVEVTVTNGEIFDEISQTWVTYFSFYEGDLAYGSPNWPFRIRWNNSLNGIIGNIHIRICDSGLPFICSNGDKDVTFGPSPYLPTISGSGTLLNCLSQQQSYSVLNLQEGWELYSWSFSSNIVRVGTGSNPITVQGTNTTYQGMETLTGVFQFSTGGNACGTQNVEKNIWLGAPSYNNQTVDGNAYYSGYQVCPGSHWAGVGWSGQVNSTSWQVWTGGSYYTTNTTCDFTIPTNGYSYYISVSATNSCGTSSVVSYYLNRKMYGCGSYYMMAYPNPVNEELTVRTTFKSNNPSQSELKAIPDELILFDRFNNKILTEHPRDSISTLNIKNVPSGEYFLKVKLDGKEHTKRIIKE